MPVLLTIVAATTTTTKSSGKSSSSTVTLVIIVVLFAAVYLLFLRPRQQRMRQQQSSARELSIGDSVVTAGGIYGQVVALDAEVVEIEVASGVVLTVLRWAVNPRPATTPTPPVDDEWPGADGPPGDGAPGDHPDQQP
jgi:preprotein translocase subunit YajC